MNATFLSSPYSANHNGRPVLLAAGGWKQDTAELLDYTQPTANWTKSKIQPIKTDFHIQWCQIKNQQSPFYVENRGTLNHEYIP